MTGGANRFKSMKLRNQIERKRSAKSKKSSLVQSMQVLNDESFIATLAIPTKQQHFEEE